MDIPADMEEVRKRLQVVASGSPRAHPTTLSPGLHPSPMPVIGSSSSPLIYPSMRDPQDMMAEVRLCDSFVLISVYF